MRIFKRASFKSKLIYNKKEYSLDIDRTTKKTLSLPIDTSNCIELHVTNRKLKGKSDLHGAPYKPTVFIFSEKVN